VSPAIAANAFEQAGYIDAGTAQEWKAVSVSQLAVRFGWSDQYRALQADADQRRAPQRLLTRAIRGYAEGVLSAQAIATLRGVTPDTVVTELRDAGIVPSSPPIAWAGPDDLPAGGADLADLDNDLRATVEPDDR